MSLTDLVTIRTLEPADVNFILDSYASCLTKYNESISSGYTREYSHNLLEKQLAYILKKPSYSVFLAVEKEDTNSIIAYIIADPSINHVYFNYTKYLFRKLGIQKYMLLPLVIDPDRLITAQFPTKEILKLIKAGKLTLANKILEDLL